MPQRQAERPQLFLERGIYENTDYIGTGLGIST
jgi:hypothetical protein